MALPNVGALDDLLETTSIDPGGTQEAVRPGLLGSSSACFLPRDCLSLRVNLFGPLALTLDLRASAVAACWVSWAAGGAETKQLWMKGVQERKASGSERQAGRGWGLPCMRRMRLTHFAFVSNNHLLQLGVEAVRSAKSRASQMYLKVRPTGITFA